MRNQHERLESSVAPERPSSPADSSWRSFETEQSSPRQRRVGDCDYDDDDENENDAYRYRTHHPAGRRIDEAGAVGDGVGSSEDSMLARASRYAIGVFLVTALIIVICDASPIGGHHLERWTHAFVEWLSEHPLEGMGAVVLVYIVATVLFVPGSLLTFGIGYAFGVACRGNVWLGVMLSASSVFVGASLGSICSFLLGRYLFRDCVFRLAASYPIFRAINGALEGNGLKIMVLLRLSPLIPYNALDYISGVTSISLGNYALALFGLLPGTVALCAVGASASSLGDHDSGRGNKVLRIVSIVAGVVFAAAGVYVASYYSKKELDRILEAEEALVPEDNASEANSEDELVPRDPTSAYSAYPHPNP